MLIFPAIIINFLSLSNDTIRLVAQVALSITLLTSLVLSYIMIKYKGKRPVDVAVVLREFAIIAVIARVLVSIAFRDPLNVWALFIYLYLAVAVGALLYLTVREQWFPPPIVPSPESEELEQCKTELAQLKENSHGNEKV